MTRDERTCAERSRSSRINRHPYQRTMQRGGNQPNRVLSQTKDREACRIAKKIMAEPSAPPGNAAPAELVLHEPRAALRGDPPVLSGLVPSAVEAVEAGFIYPDEPPCRIEQPEPCDIPASYRRTR